MEQKSLEYEGNLGKEEIILKVKSYNCGNRLYIEMVKPDPEPELFDDLTVNLSQEEVQMNEAFISDFDCKSKLQFIRKYKLGGNLTKSGTFRILCLPPGSVRFEKTGRIRPGRRGKISCRAGKERRT